MKTTYPQIKMKACELKLADVVDVSYGQYHGWDTAIVKQIADGKVILLRPYGTNVDFTYTGGVICYVGIEIEEIVVSLDSSLEFLVYKREEIR